MGHGAVDVQDETLCYHEYKEFEYIIHHKANMLRVPFIALVLTIFSRPANGQVASNSRNINLDYLLFRKLHN